MSERFISEALRPDRDTLDPSRMAAGGPGLPGVFHWRGQILRVRSVVRAWRETGPCHHGSDEQYVRKHWYEVQIGDGQVAKIYFERHPRSAKGKGRWWLYTLGEE
jgi:hypothetical protein